LQLFDGSDADVLALETIPSFTEAKVLSELLRCCRKPAWVSFSCRDEQHISDGTPLVEVARLFRDHPAVLAIGINCTPPQYVPSLIRSIRAALPNKAILAYPNSGETYDVTTNSWSGTVSPLDCATAAASWFSAGAKLVGGCCRMGPLHIRAMAKRLEGNKQ
ncbi:MAG: homocysteine S-methyltransferase, partial [Hyphomicrobiales bacterium]|nr:homocysteine S-methyltransferase [Hyphomicrobiales bacterium]